MLNLLNRRTKKFSELHPVEIIENSQVIFQDGRVAMGLVLRSFESEQLEREAYGELATYLLAIFQDLPTGATLQKYDVYYHKAWRNGVGEGLTQKARGFFEQKIYTKLYEEQVLNHKTYLFLTLGNSNQKVTGPHQSSLIRIIQNPYEGLDRLMDSCLRHIEKLEEGLRGVHITGKILNDEELDRVYRAHFNLEFDQVPQGYTRDFHTTQRESLRLGEKFVQVLSLRDRGEQCDYHQKSKATRIDAPFVVPITHELPFPHLLCTTFKLVDREKALRNLDVERKLFSAFSKKGQGGSSWFQQTEIREQEIGAFTEVVRSEGEALVELNLSVVLWDIDPAEVQNKINRTLSAFARMGGAKALVESIDTTNLFFGLAPGNSWNVYRWLLVQLRQALAYMHFTSPYRSDREGVLLYDRNQNPLLVNLFNPRLNNRNAIVVGPTGSGKSFSIGSLIIQRHEQKGTKQFIIDKGGAENSGSYRNAVQALGGKYYEYSLEYPLALNPFYVESNFSEEGFNLAPEKLVFLLTLLGKLWKGDVALTQGESAVLTMLLPQYYQEEDSETIPKFSRFYAWFKKHHETHSDDPKWEKVLKSFDADNFLLVLEPFYSGIYKDILSSDEDIDISSLDLICFDLARIEKNERILPIVSLAITEIALDQLRRFPDYRNFIYIDEAWAMLGGTIGSFIENMYRTIRKSNGSISIITQGSTEIENAAIGQVLVDNADTTIILNHSGKTQQIEKLQLVFGFTDHEIHKIRSLRKFSDSRELFIRQGDYGKVYNLKVPQEMGIIMSSSPAERNRLNKIRKQRGGNVKAALREYLHKAQSS